jgi:rhodanese-related sulfurtransferase
LADVNGFMPERIDLEGLKHRLEHGAQLVEVLPPAEYAEEHLPGALNIPLRTLDARSAEQLDRRKPVVVYCYDGL